MIITPLVYFIPAREKKKPGSVRYEKGVIKEYASDEIQVTWKPDLCVHAGNCFKGLPKVFNPMNRPWINIDAATSEEIIRQVKQCPSDALSFVKINKRN